MAKAKRLTITSLASIAALSVATHAQFVRATAPNMCLTAQETKDMQDPSRSPIQAEVKPNGDVVFHFKDNKPPPVTINGLEPIPNPVGGLDRGLQVYLHKKAKSEYMRCMADERHKLHHLRGVKK